MTPQPASRLPPAIVLGLSPTGLHVVRALARAGVRVIGVCAGLQPGRASRYLSRTIIESDPGLLLHRLKSAFPEPPDGRGKAVLIPTSDQDVEFVIRHAAALAPHFAFQPSYGDGLAAAILTKESFYELCETHKVCYPRLWRALPADLPLLRDRINYPCMIKPSRIHDIKAEMGGRKGWAVRDAQQFDSTVRQIPEQAGVLLLQEIVPGPESEITLYCAHFDSASRPRQHFTARKLRQYPPGFGSASLVQATAEDESRSVAERLLSSLGYRGIAAAEFKRDSTSGELKIIEINVRPSLWFSLTEAAQRQPVLAAYHELAGTDEELADRVQANGVRWRYTLKDVWSVLFYRLRPHFLLPPPNVDAVGAARATTHPVWAADDPLPAAFEWIHFVLKSLRRLRRTHGG
jgi:D-aspartate ligase